MRKRTVVQQGEPDISPPALYHMLSALTGQFAFPKDRHIVEIQGQCGNCAA